MISYIKKFYLLALLPLLSLSCGSGGDGDGRCVLNCSNAVMNTDVTITLLQTSSSAINCGKSTTSSTLRHYSAFLVKKNNNIDSDAVAGYVRITPAIYSVEDEYDVENLRQGQDGGWISSVNDPKLLDDKDFYLRGIITPQENFCTNSCGVFEVEYTLRCPPSPQKDSITSTVTVEARSGNSNATSSIDITVEALEDD